MERFKYLNLEKGKVLFYDYHLKHYWQIPNSIWSTIYNVKLSDNLLNKEINRILYKYGEKQDII